MKSPEPPIYIIPRLRCVSYKDISLEVVTIDEVVYCSISKGLPLNGVSSFWVGPFVGSDVGVCLVNMAFSKEIAICHIEGGGGGKLN